MKTKQIVFLLVVLIIGAMCSCNSKEAYPMELLEADNAYLQGNHTRGDHLLLAYLSKNIHEDEQTACYRKLIELEKAYMHGSLTDEYYKMADSLCRFYQDEDNDKEAKANLFMGNICSSSNDYPTAIECYLKAQTVALQNNDKWLLCIINRSIGDVYYQQRALEKCEYHYRQYFQLAIENRDTLRMAYGAYRMAKVHTINNDIDSTIYYYNLSVDLGEKLPQKADIVPVSTYALCNIYIQLEEFDKARELMSHDEQDDTNWAYWHYRQNHVDSAIYYFQRILGRYKWQGEVESLEILAELEGQRGNTEASLDYYRRLAEAKDSLRAQQKQVETQLVEARYGYDRIKAQRDRLEQQGRRQQRFIFLLLGVIIVAAFMAWMAWRTYRQQRQAAQARQQALEQEKEDQQEQSRRQQEENSRQLEALEQKLAEARRLNDEQAARRLQMESDVLTTQNQSIEAAQRRKAALLLELKGTDVYQRLKAPTDGKAEKRVSEQEWQLVSTSMDDIYDHMSRRLLGLARLSETELRVCYLLKMGLPPSDIAEILYKSKAAITLARQRMYRKFTGRTGHAEDFDQLLEELCP